MLKNDDSLNNILVECDSKLLLIPRANIKILKENFVSTVQINLLETYSAIKLLEAELTTMKDDIAIIAGRLI